MLGTISTIVSERFESTSNWEVRFAKTPESVLLHFHNSTNQGNGQMPVASRTANQTRSSKKVNVQPVVTLIFLLLSSVCGNSLFAQTRVDFSRDIQPILSENCYFCHGPDSKQRQADLRLDLEEEARDWFEPGEPDESDLYLRVSTKDKLDLMPPADSHRELTSKQIETIRRWIEEGGEWGQHWSFARIEKKQIRAKRPSDAIDFFVQRKLHENELDFATQADRRTLIRRVSIDLTGLPPTKQQIDDYLSDETNDAYPSMVDRFLASPAYGERMAWTWLDAARYADTNGYQGDNERTMWPWRDWVVKAFNDNMPFDQFSKWQLAGDLLPNPTQEQILATAFNRNHPINGEGGRIAEENRIDYVMDMAETTGTVWMGLTFNCCRCHDHKYDQLSQKDYYSLIAFFDQTPVTGGGGDAQTLPILAIPDQKQTRQKTRLESAIAEIKRKYTARTDELNALQPAWEAARLRKSVTGSDWQSIKVTSHVAENATLTLQSNGSILAGGENPDNDVYRVSGTTELKTVRGIRLETLSHETMTEGGLARSASSNFVLTGFQVYLHRADSEPQAVELETAIADYEQSGHSIESSFDSSSDSGWAVWAADKQMNEGHEAVFTMSAPLELPADAKLEIVLRHESVHAKHNIGHFRLSLTDDGTPELTEIRKTLLDALNVDPKERSEQQKTIILAAFLDSDAKHAGLKRRLSDAMTELKQLTAQFPKVMVMADMPSYRKSFLLNRGSYQEPRDEVFARVPSMFEPLPEKIKADRLALANWLFSETNPLTPRVTVNRMWAEIFGIGLVKTTEDLGVQGEPPSHPELLDWLGAEYRDSGWDTKHMLRLILNSRTYRQSSKINPLLLELDPENRLLSRAPRYRMPSWMLRDYALAASGRLVRTMGGPPVNSYQPAGVWEEASFGNKKYKMGTGNEIYRRSLYTYWRRIAAPTMFFDNADRMTCSVKAFRTNTPLHALTTLNDVTFVEAARLLAYAAMQDHSKSDKRLEFIFERLVARPPSAKESKILMNALKRTENQFRENKEAAIDFTNVGETQVPDEVDVVELASWTSLCLAVFNLDETLTRQ